MNTDKLITLYNQTSKHSHYQILAAPLQELIPTSYQQRLDIHSRYERERLAYILKHQPVQGVTLADIGGNTGFFTFELISRGARSALFFEGNDSHSEFVREAARALGWQDRITVFPMYFDFAEDLSKIEVDVCLLLNVLHHVGDDYGQTIRSADAARQTILSSLNRLASHAQTLIFQLGFNWMGDRNRPLFQNGTKKEVIDFIAEGTRDYWIIDGIGIAQRTQSGITYQEVGASNIRRDDALGEFLNRPLFILHSRQTIL